MAKYYTLTPEDFLSRQERSTLIKYCRDQALIDLRNGHITWPTRYMLVDLALYSGLRVQEIADLVIGDISFNSGHDPFILVRHGKGDKKRVVYIDTQLSTHLKEYISYKEKSLHQSIESDVPLFAGRYGKHSPTISFQKSFKVATRSTGLRERLSIHSCRHTYATFLLHDTGNLRYVQKQLGHASIAMTSLYADVLPEENGKLANMISREE
jgi:integrase